MLLEADLPDDPDALRAMVVTAHSQIAEQSDTIALRDVVIAQRENRIASLETAGTEADAEIARLTAIITAFQRHRFGARSEQFDEDQLQLAFEELDAALGGVKASLDAARKDAGTSAPRKTNRGSLPVHLERIEQIVDIEDKACAAAAAIFTSSAKMTPSGSMSFPPPSACWSPAVHAMAAVRARPRRSRPRHQRASSKVACRPRR